MYSFELRVSLTTLPMSPTHTWICTRNKVTGGWVNTFVVVIEVSLAASEAEVSVVCRLPVPGGVVVTKVEREAEDGWRTKVLLEVL